MTETVFTNARVMLPDGVLEGSVVVRDGKIFEVIEGRVAGPAEDLDGDYLIPGLVELHTDHLESHFLPRPGVAWPAIPAVMAHDAQVAAAGITTVFDALRAGSFEPGDRSAREAMSLSAAIVEAQDSGRLRAQHFIHLRCELPCADTAESAEMTAQAGPLHLISIMDHTPGARQFVSIDKFREYYIGKKLILPEHMDGYIAVRQEMQAKHASANKQAVLALASRLGVRLASHDDATELHVEEAIADGVTIAEFPTTREAAQAAHRNGLAVLMGAPNVVRGGSHSGNIPAADVAAGGHLDVLSSDYVPSSLLPAAFRLAETVPGMSLAAAMRTITINPARAAGLDDRGAIEPHRRADMIQVRVRDGIPAVRRVWREGRRVM
ncbi:MAG: alpha-D-ribose 1-methylphosphonate 5-triphosphate diphosphatase [Aestuariivirga sp.]|uniref:alpha-D-ribose 1-methylphosphonate 5-triphosphate diphosphatase n=1 Tax=Aestuariivirga sp. TaxID=2650926 RepID=UPI0025BD64CA|nr:alpha-D-ribose 1-methylphosphonate 5-triphosphate diphosphatase [Aestuariivirga sp.]MCA3560315.1 alpha-D-ribose 1-methylphosphonate 5-triphosphate diphosphatase [Aestuariivirga sp.]